MPSGEQVGYPKRDFSEKQNSPNEEINRMNEVGRKNRSSQTLYLFSKLRAQVYMKSDYTICQHVSQ